MMVAAAAGQSTANHADASPPSPAASSDLAAELETLRHKVHQLEEQMKSTSGMGGGGSSMSGMSMGDKKKDGMGMGGGMGMKKGMSGMNMSGGSDSAGGMNMSSGQQSGGIGMGGGMGMMKGMGGMGGMSMSGGSDSASGMSMSDGQQSGGMGMMGMGGGMGMMGMMKGMGGGMSGMSGIQLTTEQQAKLNQLKEKTLLNQASADRKIEEAEQELWELTAADQPDAEALESKIREVETLRGDQRLAFIRAVGEAAKVLTHEQHQVLTGAEASPTKDAAPDHSNHQP